MSFSQSLHGLFKLASYVTVLTAATSLAAQTVPPEPAPTVTETIQVSGIRCEKCVMRLAGTLEGAEGLESANANLMGQVTFSYDDERTTRDALVEVMSRGGFREQAFV